MTLIHKRLQEWLSLGKIRIVGKKPQVRRQQKAWFLYEPVADDTRN